MRPQRAGAPYLGMLSGVAIVIAAFLPWYVTNVAPPFADDSLSGWEASSLAKAAVPLGALVAVAAAAMLLDVRGALRLDPRAQDALAWIVIAASAVAAVLIGYRLLVLPDPVEFFSRQVGLYIAMAAAVAGVLSGLALAATARA
jgi:hypothetical protein